MYVLYKEINVCWQYQQKNEKKYEIKTTTTSTPSIRLRFVQADRLSSLHTKTEMIGVYNYKIYQAVIIIMRDSAFFLITNNNLMSKNDEERNDTNKQNKKKKKMSSRFGHEEVTEASDGM